MDRVATLPTIEQAELFQETANRRGVRLRIIEKDFWVCWTLKQLFELPDIGQHLIFKGGTSLSKIFRAIERFSEDIDVSINREYLGFEGDDDPENIENKNRRNKKIKALRRTCQRKVNEEVLPALNKSFAEVLGKAEDQRDSSWELIKDETDPDQQSLLFAYPIDKSSQQVQEIEYLKPIVKIEFGARADHWPAERYEITPYAAEEFPDYFEEPKYLLKVLEAERTFWEKATLLHSEYYLPEEKMKADRISRHYYDLHKLAQTSIAQSALEMPELLDHVIEHKKIFFLRPSDNYDEIRTGNIHMVPPDGRLSALSVDYDKMRDMFFGEIPSFEEVMESIARLESLINERLSNRATTI